MRLLKWKKGLPGANGNYFFVLKEDLDAVIISEQEEIKKLLKAKSFVVVILYKDNMSDLEVFFNAQCQIWSIFQ